LRQEQQPVTDTEQHASSDYQRAAVDSQSVVPVDDQSVAGASASLAGASASDVCDEICNNLERGGCGEGCREACDVWRQLSTACFQFLRRAAQCIARVGVSCEEAEEVCANELEAEAAQCDFEEFEQEL
jgi:hypothetical protein